MTVPHAHAPSAFQWSAGGWFGAQVGSTAWIAIAAILAAAQEPSAGLVAAACFVGANAIGVALWRARARMRAAAGLAALLAAVAAASLVTILSLDASGRWESIQIGPKVPAGASIAILASLFVGLALAGLVRESSARRRARD